ncbi:ROK family transcriptional regulator [Agromyces larvae]|uniref:ROK family transcriptional regulator n=1 Tax=Agromyces larvae TaxID=2929802 RepID=A0ABY4BV65_9MICO|nr:ROK family transcriptional regulator [Agromyces larvae]UOE43050.1 ROK family transcriptional regulator [Agromyces larvae]
MAVRRITSPAATSRGLILDLIRSAGPISRVELADRTGLTQATMSHVVRQLIDEGLVVESGRGESTGGKPRVLIELDPRARFALGIQLGAVATTYVVVDASGAIVGRLTAAGAAPSAEAAIADLAATIDHLLDALAIDRARVLGVGVAAPGPIDLDRGAIVAPPTLGGWRQVALRDALERASGLPVVVDNDATAAALGDFWVGTIEGSAAHCTLFMSAGIGAGILLDGAVYRGASSNAGEIGSVRGADGVRRPIEAIASPAAVAAAARSALASGRSGAFELDDGADDPFDDFTAVSTAAVLGDPLALELLEPSVDAIADQAVALANVLDLDSLVLAGPAFAVAGSLYLARVRERIDAEFFARSVHRVRIGLSPHLADAAAVGVAALVLQSELAPRSLPSRPEPVGTGLR